MIHHYIKSFFISMKKNRFFYGINLFGFLTGFLLLTIIFTFVYQEITFDRFHKKADTIYRIHSGGYGVTPMCFAEKLKNQVPEIDHIVRFSSTNSTLFKNQEEISLGKCYFTDAEVFQTFSFQLQSGDVMKALTEPFSIVIDKSTAQKLYGNHSPMGETLQDKNGRIFTITGVMDDIPYKSHIRAKAFISVETLRQTENETTFNCGSWGILTYISLVENSNKNEVEKKINKVLDDSRMGSENGKIWLQLQALKKVYFDYANNKYDGCVHANLLTISMYMAISISIMLIVLINYINLYTVISVSRIKEFAIRKVNGAKRVEIVKQILLEALVIIFLSFTIALLLIELLLPQLSHLLNLIISESINRQQLYLVYFIGITLIGVITGLIPGLFLSKVNETKALKNESIFQSKGIQRKLLLGFQLFIVAVFLNANFIVRKQINYMIGKDLGFRYENIVCSQMDKTLNDKKEILKSTLLENPKIEAVSFSNGLIGDSFTKRPVIIDSTEALCYFYSIDPDYLQLYDMKLKYGRNFSWEIRTNEDKSWLVNEKTCKKFGIENMVGKTFAGHTIIGVVKDFNFLSLHNKIEPLFLEYSNTEKLIQIKFSPDNRENTIDFIEQSSKNLSPNFQGEYSFMQNRIKQLYTAEFDLKRTFEIYAFVTLLIALLGLFGLTMFTIRKKTKEAGIRKLFGAKLRDTIKLFTKEQIWIVTISNLVAIPISYWAMSFWLSNFMYRVQISATIFIATFVISMAFVLLSILFQIIKTHKKNLAEILKYE